MRIMKKLVVAIVAMLTLATWSITASAATQYATPADAVAALTGRDVQSVIDERVQTGKTYGIIANEAGVLDKFKDAVYEVKEARLQELVADGSITQNEANEILALIKDRQAVCDGTGNGGAGLGLGIGSGCGQENGNGTGQGSGNGNGQGSGNGSGQGLGNGNGCGQGRGNGGGGGRGMRG